MNFATALLAGVALKPMRRRWLAGGSLREVIDASAVPVRS